MTATEPALRRPGVTLWLLRILLTLHVVLVLCQPLLAGLFLSGDVDAITVHGIVGSSLVLVTLVLLVCAVVYAARGRGRWWVPGAVGLLFVLEQAQVVVGYTRLLLLHIPLGVLIVTASILLAAWVWTPWARRARS